MWFFRAPHYNDVITDAIASQITSFTIVYSTVYSDADQRKHQSSASLAFVRGIHRGPVNFPHKWPVTRKMFPFDDVIMKNHNLCTTSILFHCQSWPRPTQIVFIVTSMAVVWLNRIRAWVIYYIFYMMWLCNTWNSVVVQVTSLIKRWQNTLQTINDRHIEPTTVTSILNREMKSIKGCIFFGRKIIPSYSRQVLVLYFTLPWSSNHFYQ